VSCPPATAWHQPRRLHTSGEDLIDDPPAAAHSRDRHPPQDVLLAVLLDRLGRYLAARPLAPPIAANTELVAWTRRQGLGKVRACRFHGLVMPRSGRTRVASRALRAQAVTLAAVPGVLELSRPRPPRLEIPELRLP
jgi:hypothetical protein